MRVAHELPFPEKVQALIEESARHLTAVVPSPSSQPGGGGLQGASGEELWRLVQMMAEIDLRNPTFAQVLTVAVRGRIKAFPARDFVRLCHALGRCWRGGGDRHALSGLVEPVLLEVSRRLAEERKLLTVALKGGELGLLAEALVWFRQRTLLEEVLDLASTRLYMCSERQVKALIVAMDAMQVVNQTLTDYFNRLL